MRTYKVQTLTSLRDEMKAVARGERKAPRDAARISFRDQKPGSVAALAELSGRSQPNVTRTLNKFEAIGLVSMKTIGRCKAPTAVIRSVTVEIDPYSDFDRLTVYPR
jgi:predicted transcriptional regulator